MHRALQWKVDLTPFISVKGVKGGAYSQWYQLKNITSLSKKRFKVDLWREKVRYQWNNLRGDKACQWDSEQFRSCCWMMMVPVVGGILRGLLKSSSTRNCKWKYFPINAVNRPPKFRKYCWQINKLTQSSFPASISKKQDTAKCMRMTVPSHVTFCFNTWRSMLLNIINSQIMLTVTTFTLQKYMKCKNYT